MKWLNSPDFTGVIQEVIDRGGWLPNNSLTILYSTRDREGGYRNFSSYDRGIDLAVSNFGIQEGVRFNDKTREVFTGCPTIKNGYMYVNEAPGFGVDIDDKLAAKFPLPDHPGYWSPVRRSDGTAVRP